MRYIDRTGCKGMSERGTSTNITRMGSLTEEATRIAERNSLGLLKTHYGAYKVISASGLGKYNNTFTNLEEVDGFLKNLK